MLSALGLHRVVTDYVAYYMRSLTVLGLDKDSIPPTPLMSPSTDGVVTVPEVNRPPHHRYIVWPHIVLPRDPR